MFKFGFNDPSTTEATTEPNIEILRCKEILLSNIKQNQLEDNSLRKITVGKKEITIYQSSKLSLHTLTNISEKILQAEKQHSDLIPGVYEGGLKIWECTYDLLDFLSTLPSEYWKEKNVLDLGCGAGLLGLSALANGSNVTFQDYNPEVLEYFTGPNILLNITNQRDVQNIRLFCGDWQSFSNKLHSENLDGMYDLILTSETIYNPINYEKLHHIFSNLLSKDGVAYVAGKSVYFGVGGSMHSFIEFVKNRTLLDIDVCWSNRDGVSREICKIRLKSN